MSLSAEQPALTPEAPVAAWGRALISRRVDELLACVPAARSGEDIEGLHDLRVASRRLAAAFRAFGGCFSGPAFDRLARDARRIRRRSGALRDLDVLVEALEEERASLEGVERLAMRYLLTMMQRSQRERRAELVQSLDWLEGRDLRGEADRALTDAPPDPGGDGSVPVGGSDRTPSLRQAAPSSLLERYREFYGFIPYVDQPEAEEQLHAMRIAVKRLRYTMELFAPCYVEGLKRPLANVRRLQEALGDLHDSDVRRALLRERIATPPDPRVLRAASPATADDVAAGLPLLLASEEGRRARIYGRFAAQWRDLERKSFVESLHSRLQSPDAPAEAGPVLT